MEKNEQQMPRLGEPVPAFEAMTTKGKISFPDDYKGKWVILFSHPADFTPICTTEILTFGARTEEFRALNCELVGLSVDSRNSHIAWLKTIREKIEYKGMKDVKVGFPIIDDVAMKVASLYGMIQPGESQTAAVRAVFFVDPKGVLRAMIYYPLALGRNFDEIRRVLVGLQTIDAFGIALPADWRPGDEVIVPMKGDDQDRRGFPREASSVVCIRISAIRGRSAKAAPLYSRKRHCCTSRHPRSSSRTASRFLPAICSSPRAIHPSAHATRIKVLPSLWSVPHASPWTAASNDAEKILALDASPSPSRYISVHAAG